MLLQYGSGPIKGFAVMLLVGVFTTLTTNIWVTRILFDWDVARKKGTLATHLDLRRSHERTPQVPLPAAAGNNFAFVAKFKIWLIISILLMAAAIGVVVRQQGASAAST